MGKDLTLSTVLVRNSPTVPKDPKLIRFSSKTFNEKIWRMWDFDKES